MENGWIWSHRHQEAFTAIKKELARPTVLDQNNSLKSQQMHFHLGWDQYYSEVKSG